MSKPENPQAFPRGAREINMNSEQPIYDHGETGMTLRDYFAAQALQMQGGVIPLPHEGSIADDPEWRVQQVNMWAKMAYQFADAMLKAREDD